MAETKPPLEVTPKLLYLILYNFIQCVGWTLMTLDIVFHLLTNNSCVGMYVEAKTLLNIFQTLAILEVVHAIFGLVKSNWFLTGFQVASRVFLTWHTFSVKEVHDTPGVAMFLLAWGITEIIRYSYYVCAQVNNIPYLLTWCRYTFFIALYPLGVTGELLTLYYSLPHVWKSGLFSISMPNAANFGFSYYYFLIFVMIVGYIPIFPQLYMHMFAQRRKIVGGDSKKKN